MGGNVKDAFTDEPTVMRECENCGVEFEDTYKYSPKRYCESCKTNWDDPNELAASIDLELDTDTSEVSITVEVDAPDVPDRVSVILPGRRADNREFVLGTLRVEDDAGTVWYEDAWTAVLRYPSNGGIRVKGKKSWVTPWGGEAAERPKYTDDEWESVRNEYRANVGDPFDVDGELTATFTFECDALGTVTDTESTPDYLLEL